MKVQKGLFFQVISRNNDVNGNPYRLILCYGPSGASGVVDVIEARNSTPNCVGELSKIMRQLPTFHVAPAEYNETKKSFAHLLRREN